MLDLFAQSDAASVRTDRDAELRRHEQHGQDFVDAAESTAIDLAKLNCAGLQELLEDHAVVGDLAHWQRRSVQSLARCGHVPECRRDSSVLRSTVDRSGRGSRIESIASSTSQIWLASSISFRCRPDFLADNL